MELLYIKILFDIAAVVVGIYCMMLVKRMSIGGSIARTVNFILAGLFILAMNHVIDTIVMYNYVQDGGAMSVFIMQASIVHRIINLAGFVLIAGGYMLMQKTLKR